MKRTLIRLVKTSIATGARHYWDRRNNPIPLKPMVSAQPNAKQPSGPTVLPNDNNADRALRALTTLQFYAACQGTKYDDRDTHIIDLLADLMHLASDGVPCVAVLANQLRIAEMHYQEELEEEFQNS